MLRVTVWNEFLQERTEEDVKAMYPEGIHHVLADGLRTRLKNDVTLTTSTMEDDEFGLSEALLAQTDVLVWWSHLRHDDLPQQITDRIVARVHEGMGFVVLHSGGGSTPFRQLVGAARGAGGYRHGDREVLWTVAPGHAITEGLVFPLVFQEQEMYGEPSGMPTPDELIFISSYEGGEVHRSGACYVRGQGRIFYFSPGHETYPIYYRDDVKRVIANAVQWAAPTPIQVRAVTGERPMGWYSAPAHEQGVI